MGNSYGKEHSYTSGYHVLRAEQNSPAIKAGIEPFFDFIVAFDDVELSSVYDQFLTLLQEKEGKTANLKIYSSKVETYRTVEVTPNRNWGGKGLLGLNIRFCSFSLANEIILHILDVLPNSPAKHAGLVPYSDFIVGYDHITDNVDFFDLVRESIGKPVNLFVYNANTKKCRDVVVVPSETWGSQSLLGCDIGCGYLHRIPKEDVNEVQTVTPVVTEPPPAELSSIPMPEPLFPLVQPPTYSPNTPTVPEPLSFPAISTISEPVLNLDSVALPPVTFFYSMPEGGYSFFTPIATTATGFSDVQPPSDMPTIDSFPPL